MTSTVLLIYIVASQIKTFSVIEGGGGNLHRKHCHNDADKKSLKIPKGYQKTFYGHIIYYFLGTASLAQVYRENGSNG
jgi:hypothetical protein